MKEPDLIEAIVDAFQNTPYPGDEDLTGSTYGEEPAALVADFRGKTSWQNLDVKFLDQAPDGWGTALSFFSDRALRFYLPAYLLADIRGQLDHQDPAMRLSSSLDAASGQQKIAQVWGGGTMGERARAGFDLFDAKQVAVIVQYLRWKMLVEPVQAMWIQPALDNYWLVRLTQPNAD